VDSIQLIGRNICLLCGYPIISKSSVCPVCRTENPPFKALRSWGAHQGALRKAIIALKYRRNLDLGHFFALQLAEIIKSEAWEIDLIVPVPLSAGHHKQRGYNQAACISKNLAWLLGLPHSSTATKRVKKTQEQITLDVNERFTNLSNAFYGNPATLEKRRVVIIDDVITTGATMLNCAKAVELAGAECVYGLSVGRALLRLPRAED
jgi:ComF family protein